MRRRDYLGPGLCALGAACMLAALAVDLEQHGCQGPDGCCRDPVRARRLHDARARASNRRPSPLIPTDHRGAPRSAHSGRRSRRRPRQRAPRPVVVDRPRPRSAGQPPDRADRAGLGDPEDQGRRRHERRRLGHDGGAAQSRDLAPRAGTARAGGRSRRDDAHPHRGHEHRQRRPRRDRQPRRCGSLPPHPRRRRIVVRRAGLAHAVSRVPGRLDG